MDDADPRAVAQLIASVVLGFVAQRSLAGNADVKAHIVALHALSRAPPIDVRCALPAMVRSLDRRDYERWDAARGMLLSMVAFVEAVVGYFPHRAGGTRNNLILFDGQELMVACFDWQRPASVGDGRAVLGHVTDPQRSGPPRRAHRWRSGRLRPTPRAATNARAGETT